MNGFITYAPDVEADYDIGTVATYECDTGFILVGDMTRDCVQVDNDTAVFNRQAPVCECKNFFISSYECFCPPILSGHFFLLSSTAQCPELPAIVNGFITYDPDMTPDSDIGTIAVHQCNPKFMLVGVMFRNCTVGIDGTGEWTEEPPTCIRKDLYSKNSV